MTRYRAAVIGLSGIATNPAEQAPDPVLGSATPHSHTAAYAAVPEVEVVAGCDIMPGARDAFLTTWGQTWPGLKTYDDWRELLDSEQVDILSVVTPDHLHADIAVAASEAGVRMLYLEKPLATSRVDCERILAAVRRHKVTVTVNHTRRYAPHYLDARAKLRSGTVGQLSAVVGYYGGPRAMLFRNTSHMIDTICMLVESNPVWVAAELESGSEHYGTAYAGDGGRDPARDPGASIWIGFETGVHAYLSALKTNPEEQNLTIVGRMGSISLRQMDAELSLASAWKARRQALSFAPPTRSGMVAAVHDLINCHLSGDRTQSPPEEAYKTVRILLGVLQSHASGGARVSVE